MPSNFRNMIKPLSFAGSMRRDPSEMLSDKHFLLTLCAAMVLHLIAVGVWQMMPRAKVIDIPVRALNIKLGDADVPDEKPASPTANTIGVENTLSRLVREQNPTPPAREKSVAKLVDKAIVPLPPKHAAPPKHKLPPMKEKAFDLRAEANAVAAPVMSVVAKQYVRETNPVVKVGGPVPGEHPTSDAEIMSRYEQLISLWIQKFKLYPEEARNGFMQGETVVRIRVDRRGNIRYYTLERSTGHEVLDHAAIDMIKRANPVPAAPTDYPPGDLLEFLIPVNFQLQ